jgi:hypothetical protein
LHHGDCFIERARSIRQVDRRSRAGVSAAIVSGAMELVSGAAELHQLKTLRDGRLSWLATEQDARKNKKPGAAGLLTNIFFSQFIRSSFRQLGDLMRQPRDLSARIVLVNDVALGCLHQLRFRVRHRLQRRIAVAALDRFFDNADRASHLGAARLVDDGAAGNLARRLFGGGRIGHVLKYPSAVTDR